MSNREDVSDSEYDSGYCSSEDKAKKENKKVQKHKKSGEDGQKSKAPPKTAPKKPVASKRKKDEGGSVHPFDKIQCNVDLSENYMVEKRFKISPTLIIQTKLVEVKEEDRSYSYPAIVFLRRIAKDDSIYEFNVPLNLGRNIISALQDIVNS